MFPALSQKTRIAAAFACVYFFWGSTYGAIHIAGMHLAPPLVGAIRSLFSFVLIGVICLARGTSLRVPLRTAGQLALVGVLIMTANNVLLIWAETKVSSGYASLVVAMIPIFIALFETVLPHGERLNLRGWLGTLLGALGMLVLLWPTLHRVGSGTEGRSLFGFVLLIGAALSFAIGSILARRWSRQPHPRHRRRLLPHRPLDHQRTPRHHLPRRLRHRRRSLRLHLPATARPRH
jgi:drug/metabolite transporter (DMT)-like permease